MNKERLITMMIITGLFGGLIGGPIAGLVDYHAPPQKRLWLFFGFACVALMIYYGKSRNHPIFVDMTLRRVIY